MSDKSFEKIIKSIDTMTIPPEGVKEKVLGQILTQNSDYLFLSKIESNIFEKPLRAACALSIFISGVLWAVMGNGYTSILYNLIGIR